jgi:hypothetical protein
LKQPYGKDQQRLLDCFPLQALILVYDRHKFGVKGWLVFWKGEGKEVENFGVLQFGQGTILVCFGFSLFLPSINLSLPFQPYPPICPFYEFPSLS